MWPQSFEQNCEWVIGKSSGDKLWTGHQLKTISEFKSKLGYKLQALIFYIHYLHIVWFLSLYSVFSSLIYEFTGWKLSSLVRNNVEQCGIMWAWFNSKRVRISTGILSLWVEWQTKDVRTNLQWADPVTAEWLYFFHYFRELVGDEQTLLLLCQSWRPVKPVNRKDLDVPLKNRHQCYFTRCVENNFYKTVASDEHFYTNIMLRNICWRGFTMNSS